MNTYIDMSTYIQMNKILKESPSHRELRLKIQSLIDNYCDHEMTQSKINDGLLYCVKCKIYEAHE